MGNIKIQNPHDKMFKETFSNIEVTKSFINNYLPENIIKIINLETLELEKDSFIDEKLNETFSDLLFGANINNNDGYIYLLFEHKSYKSRNIAFQLLKYMVEIWESKVKEKNYNSLPIIIPLVIYHNKEKWGMKTSLGEMINGYKDIPDDIKVFIPDYEYLLYDVSRYKDEEIKGNAQVKIIFTAFRDIFAKDKEGIKETIALAGKYLRELEDKQTGIEYFETFLRYIFHAGKSFDEKDVIEIIDKVERSYPEGSELVMTTAERLRKEGIKEGIKEGEKSSLLRTSIRLLTKKFGVLSEDITKRIEELDSRTLEVLIDDIFLNENLSFDEIVAKYLKQYTPNC